MIPFNWRQMAFVKFNGRKIATAQLNYELNEFGKIISELHLKTILEIGTYRGGTLLFFTKVAEKNATIISIDLPTMLSTGQIEHIKSFGAEKQQDIHIILNDCHLDETLTQVVNILNNRPLDLLFIDECHSYKSTKRSYELYKPLVRAGGVIAFHDIMPNYPSRDIFEVHRLWSEIKNKDCVEIVSNPKRQKGYGIGILYVT